MAIVSVSINEKLLKKLDSLKEELGYSGRSEIIRSSIRSFIEQKEELENLEGEIKGLVTIKHEEGAPKSISEIQHKYQKLVKTQIHDHLEDHTCVQIYLVSGDAERIIEFWKEMKSNKKVKKAEFTKI